MKLSLETGLNLFHGSYLLLSCSNLFAIMFLGALLVYLGSVVLCHVWLVHMLVSPQVINRMFSVDSW